MNALTSDQSDWATNCPEYKVTAVEVVLAGVAHEAAVEHPTGAEALA